MTPVLKYADGHEAEAAKRRAKWARDTIKAIQSGARFDHVPIGHEAFYDRVCEELEAAEDALFEFVELGFVEDAQA